MYKVVVSYNINIGRDETVYEGNDKQRAQDAFVQASRSFFTTQNVTDVRFYVNGQIEACPEDL